MVADNDLAVGQIVEAVSRSKFWAKRCIFIVEDDPQNGFDHVDGHRTVAFVISPYTKRKHVDSTNYNQTGMVKTIELILGLPPMNQLDLSATPMAPDAVMGYVPVGLLGVAVVVTTGAVVRLADESPLTKPV